MKRFVLLLALLGCDNRSAIAEPDPTFARMLDQRRADPWERTSAFDDGKVMQSPPAGALPIDDATDAPVPAVTRELLAFGRTRFEAVCAVCHGMNGTGVSVVATKMALRPPPSIVDDDTRARPPAEIARIITAGYGLMPSYGEMLGHEDVWAIAQYLRALQLSQRVRVDDLPVGVRDQALREAR